MIRKKEVFDACALAAEFRDIRRQKYRLAGWEAGEIGWFEDTDVHRALVEQAGVNHHVSYKAIQRHLNNLVKDGVLIKKGRGQSQANSAVKKYRVLTPVEIARKKCGHEEP